MPVVPQTWIVLLTYNGLDDTRKCLKSLGRLDEPACPVILVDNGSSDGVLDIVHDEFSWCHTLRLPANVGPSAANNRGIAYALDRGAEFVILLNNDTIVSRDLVRQLLDASAHYPEFGVIGPIINWMDEPEIVMTDGVRFNPPGFPGFFARRPVTPQATTPPTVVEVDVVNACCMLVRAEVFRRVGLFDERFFFYHDETDFCLRARVNGLSCGILARQLVWHKGSSSLANGGRPLQRYYDARNLGLLLWKHRGARYNGRSAAASTFTYLKHLYYRYCVECEAQHPDAARAVVEGLSDALAGRYGPRQERLRPGAAGIGLLFDGLRAGRAGLEHLRRIAPHRNRATRAEPR
jgi:GT2 family glycosyltransferase